MVDGFSKGKKLYKDLITKAHPDRFLDDESKNLANDLSSRITKSKLNYQELKELEVEVREFLAKANWFIDYICIIIRDKCNLKHG